MARSSPDREIAKFLFPVAPQPFLQHTMIRNITKSGRKVMFIARDLNKDLYLFSELPLRGKECWWAPSGLDGTYLRLEKSLYPEVSWDTEPLKVELAKVATS
jgi:hypothetical protein